MTERRDLIKGATFPRYASSGHLVYAQGGNLLAMPFDAQGLVVSGAPTVMVEGVLESTVTGAAQFSISNSGSLAYVAGGILANQRQLVWVNRNGKETPLEAPQHTYLFPRVAPDGLRAAVAITEERPQIWVFDFARATLSRLTFEGIQHLNAVWSPDGKRIAFQSRREGSNNIYTLAADGSGQMEELETTERPEVPMSWSPDGQSLAFIDMSPETGYDLWILPLNERKPRHFLQTPFNESAPRFSPDGHWLAYVTNESGRYQVCVQPYPGPGGKVQISTDGGTEQVWNPSGHELFYREGNKMMAVDVNVKGGFQASKPRVLFEGQFLLSPATAPNYDVSPDGQRFLMIKVSEPGGTALTQINVVLNWFEELKRHAPAGKK